MHNIALRVKLKLRDGSLMCGQTNRNGEVASEAVGIVTVPLDRGKLQNFAVRALLKTVFFLRGLLYIATQ